MDIEMIQKEARKGKKKNKHSHTTTIDETEEKPKVPVPFRRWDRPKQEKRSVPERVDLDVIETCWTKILPVFNKVRGRLDNEP